VFLAHATIYCPFMQLFFFTKVSCWVYCNLYKEKNTPDFPTSKPLVVPLPQLARLFLVHHKTLTCLVWQDLSNCSRSFSLDTYIFSQGHGHIWKQLWSAKDLDLIHVRFLIAFCEEEQAYSTILQLEEMLSLDKAS
jgi:hypothetical protein